ncbi:hypothetical protein, partial [Luteimonas panaciterrae]|uniref:hypothetical protein n=1 Tax=Luteimonas panaciterrae TaxID=363885 RepID=UPI003CCCA0AE
MLELSALDLEALSFETGRLFALLGQCLFVCDAFGFRMLVFQASGLLRFFLGDAGGFRTRRFETFGFETFGFEAFGFESFGFESFGFESFGFEALGFEALGFETFGFETFGF